LSLFLAAGGQTEANDGAWGKGDLLSPWSERLILKHSADRGPFLKPSLGVQERPAGSTGD